MTLTKISGPFKPPSRLERLLFAKLGESYTPHHVRLLTLLEMMSAGANELRNTLKPMIYYRLAADAMCDLERLGLAATKPGMSGGGSCKRILIYSITDAGRELLAKAREGKK